MPPAAEQLRQPGGVAEHVGDPHLGAAHAEVLLEVALAVDDLAHQALTGRQVHVGLDPLPTDRDPLPGGHLLGDAGEELGLALARPTRTAGPASATKRCSGSASSSRTADENVRTHLRTVSRVGHSHAVSMWAWPVATTRCVPAPAGRSAARRRGGDARRRAAPRRRRRRAHRRARAGCARGAGRAPGGCASPRRARRSRRAAPRRRGRRAPRRRGRGRTADRRRRWRASRAATAGTAGTTGWTPPRRRPRTARRPVPRPRPGGAGGGRARRGRRRRGPGPPSRTRVPDDPIRGRASPRCGAAPARGVRPVLGHGAREAEPRRVPGLAPRSTHGERRQLVERRPGLDVRASGGRR